MEKLTLAILRERAKQGDKFAARALKVYKTDAQLQAAIKLSKSQDFTDGGGLRGA